MHEVGQRLAQLLPYGSLRVIEQHGHVAPPEVLAPIVAEFLTATA